ncbi:MAG: LPS export ABC transporter ATP-binding protein [Isosphaeraceae bacterium]
MALLEVRGLEKWYGRRQVVNGVDFDVNRGEVVGLLGPNGAGKTTSFRMTIGLIDSDGGKVLFDGRDVTRLPMYQRARLGMGYLAQDSSVFKQLSVEDNLMAILETRPLSRKQRRERQDDLLDQFGLTRIRRTKANRVSGGERRRLEIARSLITEPKLIMLDEPFAGIDPKTVSEIQDQIRSLVETYDIGILLTDHQFRETIQVTDRTYVIREGRVFAHGDREQIVNNPEVRRHYIGERFEVGHLLSSRHVHALGEARQEPESIAANPAVVDLALDVARSPRSPDHPLALPPDPPAPQPPAVVREVPAIEPTPNDPAMDFEAIFTSSVTVTGSMLIEQVEGEAAGGPAWDLPEDEVGPGDASGRGIR